MAFRKINLSGVNTTTANYDDRIPVFGASNTSSANDLGFLAKKDASTYSGLVRDGDNSQYYLIETLSTFVNDDVQVGNITALATINVNEIKAATVTYNSTDLETTISNLQTSIDSKLNAASYNAADVLIKLLSVDGAGSALDADKLDGQQGTYYLDYANFTNIPTNVSTFANDSGYLTTETTTTLALNANVLTYTDETGTPTNIDLSVYLDDTNLARLTSGTLNATTGIATFTRDDASTFDVDFSSLLVDVFSGNYNDLTNAPTNVSAFTNDAGYLTSYTETDPIYTASSWYSTTNNSASWNAAASWGNHATQGYLTSASMVTLTDVDTTGAVNGSILKYNGTTWVVGTDDAGTSINNIDDIGDVVITSPTNGQVLKYNGTNWINGTDISSGGSGVFSESYTSGDQTIVSAGYIQLTHGMTGAPDLVQLRLKCTTAEGNYSVNDEVIIDSSFHYSRGISVVPDSTYINLRFSDATNVFEIANKTTGALFGITNSNWKLIVKAWS